MSCDANTAEEDGSSLYEWLNIIFEELLLLRIEALQCVWLRNIELAIAGYELMLYLHGDFSDAYHLLISF